MEDYKEEEAIVRNLEDAGCSPEDIECFLKCQGQEKTRDQMKLLAKHRCSLLEAVHEEQKRIDCLDYLVYQLEKQKKK